MVSAISIGNTILNKAFGEGIDITPMKLQKLVYFVYKDYLKQTEVPLFSERFEVWKYGPVLRSIYDAYKHEKANAIKNYAVDADGAIYLIEVNSSSEFREALNSVWDKYKNYNGIILSRMTHRNGSAWYKAAIKGEKVLSDVDIKTEEDFA